ncbi:basic membrane lipoprotein [[Clostridium] sordellii]|uniref:BMP family lipoprotein n=2 Tax=Paraclostridium sordellii TaxID=1505 RepID=UPI0002DEDF51|nr:BMP family ABC transporter substrate-binding protein [Paeniclostridium sordellii]CEK29685.1 basic membrane lipoprotein [[Clostridium] sordellii] [Paeniclostridium sordellii]
MKLNYKKIIVLTSLILIIIIAYLKEVNQTKTEIKDNKTTKVAIIFNESGLGDKSFNDLCYDGMLKAQEKLEIEFDYAESKSKNDYVKFAREYAKKNEYDLIISVGGEQKKAVQQVSREFSNQKFTIIDSKLNLPNVSSISTNWAQQTFLHGVIAGLELSKDLDENKSAGVILGKELNHLNEGFIGFEAGVKYINPNINVMKAVVDDFSDPAKAKEIALSMYNKGAVYIQQLAGQSGLGVFLAAKQVNKYAFGVDGNQNSFAPYNIVSTATRYANDIIYKEIEAIKYNSWKSGVHKIGLGENVIDYTREGSSVELDSNTIENVEKIKRYIINNDINIPTTNKELSKWVKNNHYKLNE